MSAELLFHGSDLDESAISTDYARNYHPVDNNFGTPTSSTMIPRTLLAAKEFSSFAFVRYRDFAPLSSENRSRRRMDIASLPVPLRHLAREKAGGAVALVLHAEVLVDLQQALLHRGAFEQLRLARVGGE